MGFASRTSYLVQARALTSQFHPYPLIALGAVYFLLHYPSHRCARPLAGTVSEAARTFLDLYIAIEVAISSFTCGVTNCIKILNQFGLLIDNRYR